MKPEASGTSQRGVRAKRIQGQGPNWVLIVGGALLSTLSIKVGWRVKQFFDGKQSVDSRDSSTVCRKSGLKNCTGAQKSNRDINSMQNGENCHSCPTGDMETKSTSCRSVLEEEPSLPLVMVPRSVRSKEGNDEMWMASPERLELVHKPFHHSNSSDSLRLSESGSDIFAKRDVIQKLRQQLKRRDDMIMEMQTQLRELQTSLSTQMTQSSHLHSRLDCANKDLFDSKREIQRLQMAIIDHNVTEAASPRKPASCPAWHPESNGHSNGYADVNALDLQCIGMEKGVQDGEKIELLKREVQELKEIIEGKDFLLQSYREQKTELTVKVKELQQRLNCQVPNIL